MSLDLLTVILDVNPAWWGRVMEELGDKEGVILSRAMDAVICFCDTYRLLSSTNKLMIVAAGWASSTVLYSNDDTVSAAVRSESESASSSSIPPEDNFLVHLKNRLRSLIAQMNDEAASGTNATRSYRETRLAAPLAQALCYTHRLRKENTPGRTVKSRVLIVKISDDTTSQHMSLMNIFFTAQKQHVLIDSCVLLRDSALMQQACDITGGIYAKISEPETILQNLLCLFLPNPDLRTKTNFPSTGDVDYRPACFCHQRLISMGWVCSVCLSVFCKFSPICPTCQTVFKFLPVLSKPKMVKKKKLK